MKYQPKRSRKQWLEKAPPYVLACYDNGGPYSRNGTCDRYTVLFGAPLWTPKDGRDVPYLGMSGAPTHPQGFSQWGEMPAHRRKACGKHIRWLDLPEHIRRHVIARANPDAGQTWRGTVRETYSSLEQLRRYDRNYGIVRRCGFKSARALWQANPLIGGSTASGDFGIVYHPEIPLQSK